LKFVQQFHFFFGCLSQPKTLGRFEKIILQLVKSLAWHAGLANKLEVSRISAVGILDSWYIAPSSEDYLISVATQAGIKLIPVDRRIRIVIADDHPLIRTMIRSTLEEHHHFHVCGEAEDGAKAIEEAEKHKPDVVVLDVTMPKLSGLEAAREIKAKLPQTAIVILSANADRHFVEEAKKIGVQAYVAKTKAGEALVKAIESAVAGGDFILMD
jgi:CheY-like chemotaxis protein